MGDGQGLRRRTEALRMVRSMVDEAKTLHEHLVAIHSHIDSLDYSYSDPERVYELKAQVEKLQELELAIHDIRLRIE